jgi:serine/threonine-protein kinase RsbW
VTTPPATAANAVDTGHRGDVVDITLPADPGYLALIRTTTAALAARLDFTLDEIEDLRIAIDEACALLLTDCIPGTTLRCTFELLDDTIEVDVTIASVSGTGPDETSFAWTVLNALASSVTTHTDGDLVTIALRKRREARE